MKIVLLIVLIICLFNFISNNPPVWCFSCRISRRVTTSMGAIEVRGTTMGVTAHQAVKTVGEGAKISTMVSSQGKQLSYCKKTREVIRYDKEKSRNDKY